MTEERLESLSLTELRELARERGLSGVSALRKQDLIQKLKGEPRSRIEQAVSELPPELREAADGGTLASGLLEIVSEGGFGFLRSANYLPGEEDVYVSPSQIRRFRLRTGDLVTGVKRLRGEKERYSALLYVNTVNGVRAAELRRANFEEMTPIFPSERIPLSEGAESTLSLRVIDLIAPIGKGQRGLIVAPPKAGKTTLLKEIAKAVRRTRPEIHLIVLLIDERPEEVTDIKEYIADPEVEVIYSTFDREPEQHRRVAEMAIEQFKGTGNMELMLDRRLAERRIFPAIDIARSGTRREELLLSPLAQSGVAKLRRLRGNGSGEQQTEQILELFSESADNETLLKRLRDSK